MFLSDRLINIYIRYSLGIIYILAFSSFIISNGNNPSNTKWFIYLSHSVKHVFVIFCGSDIWRFHYHLVKICCIQIARRNRESLWEHSHLHHFHLFLCIVIYHLNEKWISTLWTQSQSKSIPVFTKALWDPHCQ